MGFFDNVSKGYSGLVETLNFTGNGLIVVNLLALTIFITVLSLLILKFYQTLSNRDLIKLNLSQYNKSGSPLLGKIGAIFLFFIEYILVMPLVIALWFGALAVFVLMVVESKSVFNVLLISAVLVASIRILSYHKEEISKDLAKMFPLIMLSTFLLSPKALNFDGVFSEIAQIPSLFNEVIIFLVFIFAVEIILRLFYVIMQFFGYGDNEEDEDVSKDYKIKMDVN
jgi:hypothetical protein